MNEHKHHMDRQPLTKRQARPDLVYKLLGGVDDSPPPPPPDEGLPGEDRNESQDDWNWKAQGPPPWLFPSLSHR